MRLSKQRECLSRHTHRRTCTPIATTCHTFLANMCRFSLNSPTPFKCRYSAQNSKRITGYICAQNSKRINSHFCAIFIVLPKLHNFGKLCYGAMPSILGYDAFRQTFGHATCKIIRAKNRNLQNATPRGRKPKQMQSRAPLILRRSKSLQRRKRRRRNRKGLRQSLQNKIRSQPVNNPKNMNIHSLRRIMLEE